MNRIRLWDMPVVSPRQLVLTPANHALFSQPQRGRDAPPHQRVPQRDYEKLSVSVALLGEVGSVVV
ncbi:hypothetical protein E2C01_028235 [Portunus trituberculatus]|uniref:Uncharacterized protein n=1 Tax=Portunus trituberculatus TaxID=210409 RepID=A0A5B7EKT5_PORTR|nr:hypothetical protein [Portunus trituberculatus]